MANKVFAFVLFLAVLCFCASYHTDTRSTDVHTPLRWIAADSTARVGLSVAARDTQKVCFQASDTTFWMLMDNSPLKWSWVGGRTVDSLYVKGAVKTTRLTGTLTGNVTGTSDSAKGAHHSSTLTNARTIGGTSFNGSANIVPDSATKANTLHGGNCIPDSLNVAGTVIQKNGLIRALAPMGDGLIMQLSTDAGYKNGIYNNYSGSGPQNNQMRFLVATGNGSQDTVLTLRGNKTVGIGVTLPTATLHVSGGIVADSIIIPTGTFACTLKTTYWKHQQIGVATYQRVGRQVFINLPALRDTSTSSTQAHINCILPAIILPSSDLIVPIAFQNVVPMGGHCSIWHDVGMTIGEGTISTTDICGFAVITSISYLLP